MLNPILYSATDRLNELLKFVCLISRRGYDSLKIGVVRSVKLFLVKTYRLNRESAVLVVGFGWRVPLFWQYRQYRAPSSRAMRYHKDVTFPAASSVDMARFLYFPGSPQADLCLGGAVKAK